MALPVSTVVPTPTPSVAITSLGSGDQPHGGGDVVHVQPLRTMTNVGWLRTTATAG